MIGVLLAELLREMGVICRGSSMPSPISCAPDTLRSASIARSNREDAFLSRFRDRGVLGCEMGETGES